MENYSLNKIYQYVHFKNLSKFLQTKIQKERKEIITEMNC